MAKVDTGSDRTLRAGRKVPYLLVLGRREAENRTVTVRGRKPKAPSQRLKKRLPVHLIPFCGSPQRRLCRPASRLTDTA